MEEGSTLGAFEVKPYNVELARCQYFLPVFNVGGILVGINTSTTQAYYPIKFHCPTRIAPTGFQGVGISSTTFWPSGATAIVTFYSGTIQGASLSATGTGLTANGTSSLTFTANGIIAFTGAEL